MQLSLRSAALVLLFTPIPALASFPKALTLSDDATVSTLSSISVYRFLKLRLSQLELVLADIPFFSVGLLGFGVFTFFFVMRRISRCVTKSVSYLDAHS